MVLTVTELYGGKRFALMKKVHFSDGNRIEGWFYETHLRTTSTGQPHALLPNESASRFEPVFILVAPACGTRCKGVVVPANKTLSRGRGVQITPFFAADPCSSLCKHSDGMVC